MKKRYQQAELELIRFRGGSILTTSLTPGSKNEMIIHSVMEPVDDASLQGETE